MRRLFLAIGLLAGSITSSWAMDLACNLNGIVYYGDQLVFKNVLYQGKWWYLCDPNNIMNGDEAATTALRENPGSALNADRYPIKAPYNGKAFAMNVLVSKWKEIFPEGEFTVQFKGSGEVRLGGLHTATIPSEGAQTTYTFTLNKSDMAWGTMGTFQRQPRNKENLRVAITKSDQADPIRNLYVLLPGVENYDDRIPFTDAFLARVKYSPFTILRFMDWAKVNYSREKDWSDRTTRGAIIQSGGFEGKYPHGVAWEFMVDLCNQADKDLWLCVPAYTTQAYWDKLAELVFNRLEPERNVWIEYANEVWNGMFVGYEAAVTVSRNNNLPPIDKGWQHNNYGYTYQTVRITETFKKKFGAQKDRIIPMLCGWANGVTWSQLRVDALSDSKVNPNNLRIKYFGTTAYFGAPAGTDKLLSGDGNWKQHIDMCQNEGLDWISYEAGHGGRMPKDQLKSAYTYTLGKLKNAGMKVYNEFHLSTTWGRKTYGALEYYSQPVGEAPKYDAICDFAVANNGYDRANVDKLHTTVGGVGIRRVAPAGVAARPVRALFQQSTPVLDMRGRVIGANAARRHAPMMLLQTTPDNGRKAVITGVNGKH